MGGKSSAPAPDPRMAEAANRQLDMAERQYNDYRNIDMPYMREIADEALGISRRNSERAGALSDYQLESMKFNAARYRDVAIPFEDQLLKDVNRFGRARSTPHAQTCRAHSTTCRTRPCAASCAAA